MKDYLKNIHNRIAEIKMLHIGLNDRWRFMDVWFVITGHIL
jgi:hypothetical protein